MKKTIIGIIVEFNPFHNGHKYLINKIKESYPNAVIIAAMSGQFVQRGELAIYDKWIRAKSALENDIDLIVEIPVYSVLNHANIFAKKAIEILYNLGSSKIFFGSENLDIKEINETADFVISNYEKLEELKIKFHSLPKAFEELVKKDLESNDILGICYILEAKKAGIDIEFNRIKRNNNEEFTSASNIRALIRNDKISKNSLIINESNYMDIEKYSDIIIGKLVTSNTNINIINYIKKVAVEKGLNSFNELINISSNKTFTKSNIRREILKFVLELENSDVLLVLGCSEKGKSILKNANKYTFRHNKKNIDNYNVERFIAIKSNNILDKELSKSTILK